MRYTLPTLGQRARLPPAPVGCPHHGIHNITQHLSGVVRVTWQHCGVWGRGGWSGVNGWSRCPRGSFQLDYCHHRVWHDRNVVRWATLTLRTCTCWKPEGIKKIHVHSEALNSHEWKYVNEKFVLLLIPRPVLWLLLLQFILDPLGLVVLYQPQDVLVIHHALDEFSFWDLFWKHTQRENNMFRRTHQDSLEHACIKPLNDSLKLQFEVTVKK